MKESRSIEEGGRREKCRKELTGSSGRRDRMRGRNRSQARGGVEGKLSIGRKKGVKEQRVEEGGRRDKCRRI